MPNFIYYVPGKQAGATTDEIAAVGLGYALDGPLTTVGVRGGPDGGDGVLAALASQVAPEQLGYYADQQTWRKVPRGVALAQPVARDEGAGEVWVGVYNSSDRRPSPESLAKPKQLDGHLVILGDDRPWLVPVARGYTEQDGELRWYHALPQRSVLGEDGRWAEGEVLPRLASLWELALGYEEAWQSAILGDEGGTGSASGEEGSAEGGAGSASVKVAFDFDGLHSAAIEVLSHNYRIGPAEADLLGLLTMDISREILEATIDLPTRLAWFKKKQSVPPAAG